MDFALTEEQELLLESIRELLKSFPEEYFKEGDKNHRYPYEFMKALADSGISLLDRKSVV